MKIERKEHFSLRKLKFGLASVAVASSLFAVAKVTKADDMVAAEQEQSSLTDSSNSGNQTSNQVIAKTDTAENDIQEAKISNAEDTAAAPSTSSAANTVQTGEESPVTEASLDSQPAENTAVDTPSANNKMQSDEQNTRKETLSDNQPTKASTQAVWQAQNTSKQQAARVKRLTRALRLTNTFVDDGQGNWYYLDANGKNVTGSQIIDGKAMYFAQDGKQVKGAFAQDKDGNRHYYDRDSGEMWTNRFVNDQGNWYYLNNAGIPVTGRVSVNDQILYFKSDGSQVKGGFVTENGSSYYYDENSGDLLRNTNRIINGVSYQFGNDGKARAVDKVEVVKTNLVIDSYEFGPSVSKIILNFNRKVTPAVVHAGATVTTAGIPRKILNSYISNASGHVVYFDSSNYVTLELDIPYDPKDSSRNASPFIYDSAISRNKWVQNYVVKVNNLRVQADGSNSSQLINSQQDAINNRLLPTTDRFSERGTYGNFNYAAYQPETAVGGEKNPLIVWLHGVGEVGTDINLPLLASNVVRLTENPIQNHFTSTGKGTQRGAYVLVPQTSTPWSKNQTAALMRLIRAYVASHPDIDSKRIYLAGLSNGGGMTLDMGVAYPNYFAALVPISASYRNQLTDNNNRLNSTALSALRNQPMWMIHTRADDTVPAESNVLPFYKKILEAGAQNKWLSYYETNVGRHYSGVTYSGHWSWVYFLNDQVTGVQNVNNAKNWSGLSGMVATNPTYGGDAKAIVNGIAYSNVFDWLNGQRKR